MRHIVLGALVLGFLLLAAAQFFVVRLLVERQLLDVEAADAFERLDDFHHALDVLKDDLASTTADWSQWDEAFDYTTRVSDDFDEVNLDPGTIARLRLNFVIVVDDRGVPRFARMLSPDGVALVDAPADVVALARTGGPLLNPEQPEKTLTGFIDSAAGVFLISSAPVLKSIEPSAPSGRMIMGRSFAGFVVPALRRMTGEALAASTAAAATSAPHERRLQGPHALSVRESELHGVTPIEDLWGRRVASLEAVLPRNAQTWLGETSSYRLGATFVLGVVLCLGGALLLRSRIVAPLEELAATVERIGRHGDTRARVPALRGVREFEMLSASINAMLAQLDQQQGMRRDRDAAVAANRLKSEFLATMSHEIRTPMNGVLGMCELLQRTELNPRQRHLSDTIVRSARSLLDILNDILDFSKIESGKLELEEAPFSPAELMQSASAPFMAAAHSKGVALHVRTPRNAPAELLGDPLRLRQVLNNLLSNALKFTERGSVTLSCEVESETPDAATLCFTVRDTGIGVALEVQDRIFDPFAQADMNTSRCYGGTGLGLAIVRRLIDLMGGRISVRSAPGEGAEFSFTVTLKRASKAPRVSAAADTTGARFAPSDAPNVLLAEDNAINREVLTEMLEHFGCRVTGAENGAQALQKAAEGRFDVVLMDCHMPVMDGCTASAELRALERAEARTPTYIVALTADATVETRLRCIESGMNDVVAKPVTQTRLRSLILRACGAAAGEERVLS